MERRLNKKLESYITSFKDSIREKVTHMGLNKNELKINSQLSLSK